MNFARELVPKVKRKSIFWRHFDPENKESHESWKHSYKQKNIYQGPFM